MCRDVEEFQLFGMIWRKGFKVNPNKYDNNENVEQYRSFGKDLTLSIQSKN